MPLWDQVPFNKKVVLDDVPTLQIRPTSTKALRGRSDNTHLLCKGTLYQWLTSYLTGWDETKRVNLLLKSIIQSN